MSKQRTPIDQFLDELQQYGRSERTREAYRRVLTDFRTFLTTKKNRDTNPFRTATREDCLDWVDTLRAQYADSTLASYVSYVDRFYGYMIEIGEFEANPMSIVIDGLDEQIESDPTRRDISIDEFRSGIQQLLHPLNRAAILTLLKTGMRVGELVNLDLRDLTLASIDIDDTFDILPRGQLVGRGPSLFVSNTPQRGESYNNETRSASNKRERDTIIPIDDELEYALIRWLAIRPDAQSQAEPLFLSTKHQWGHRLTTDQVRQLVRTFAKNNGWYQEGAEAGENVTPHYFRHYFTTHLRDRTGDRGIVKYLRGDVAEDVIDTYTHNWGDRVRSTYQSHIYQLT